MTEAVVNVAVFAVLVLLIAGSGVQTRGRINNGRARIAAAVGSAQHWPSSLSEDKPRLSYKRAVRINAKCDRRQLHQNLN